MQIINLLRSLIFNIKYLPFRQAIYMPIWVTSNFGKFRLRRGQLILKQPLRKSVFLGEGGSLGLQHFKSGLFLGKGAKLIINGLTVIAEGSVLRCDDDAIMEIGSNFYCNKNCYIRTASRLAFGDSCSLGWNIQINTGDGHPVWHDGKSSNTEEPVEIGNHVWITSNVVIGKGVRIADGCIVAQGAVVTKSVDEPNCLVGGVPAAIKRRCIRWEK